MHLEISPHKNRLIRSLVAGQLLEKCLKPTGIDYYLKCRKSQFLSQNPHQQDWQAPKMIVYKDWYNLPKKITEKPISKEDKLKKAHEKFNELLPKLLKKHEGKFVAIVDDSYEIHNDKRELFKIILKKYGYKTIYIDKISTEKTEVRMRSPRLNRM